MPVPVEAIQRAIDDNGGSWVARTNSVTGLDDDSRNTRLG